MEPVVVVAAIAALLVWSWLTRAKRKQHSNRRAVHPTPGSRAATTRARYVGDYIGPVRVEYSPKLDGVPAPGEVVWTWVPFEEDHSQGKDRPVLLVGHDGAWLLGVQLSSQDRTCSPRHNQQWITIGSGPWDPQRRPSAVRVDRIVRVDPAEVRREGAVLDRRMFNTVARSLGKLHH